MQSYPGNDVLSIFQAAVHNGFRAHRRPLNNIYELERKGTPLQCPKPCCFPGRRVARVPCACLKLASQHQDSKIRMPHFAGSTARLEAVQCFGFWWSYRLQSYGCTDLQAIVLDMGWYWRLALVQHPGLTYSCRSSICSFGPPAHFSKCACFGSKQERRVLSCLGVIALCGCGAKWEVRFIAYSLQNRYSMYSTHWKIRIILSWLLPH